MVACATFVGVAPSGSFSASAFLGAQLLRATARPPALAWSLVACCAAEEMAAYTERIVSPAHRPVLPAANSAHAVTERLGAKPLVRPLHLLAARAEERKTGRERSAMLAGAGGGAGPPDSPCSWSRGRRNPLSVFAQRDSR
jgi:hypothetical protein